MTAALIAAVAAAVAAGALAWAIRPPTRRLGPAVTPYVQRARLLMGEPVDTSVLAPPPTRPAPHRAGNVYRSVAERLSLLVDANGAEGIARRLRHAGWRDLTVEGYRLRQLRATLTGAALVAGIALVSNPSGAGALLGAGLGAAWGASRWRAQVGRMVTRRQERLRGEAYTAAHLLAISIRAGTAPIVAIRDLATASSGAIAEDLGDALDAIDHGSGTADALERVASDTPEPAAGRLYRLLATADSSGDTLAGGLLAMADDIRAQRREAVERLATRRRFAMLAPTILLMGPVMFLFVTAPIPTFIFGN